MGAMSSMRLLVVLGSKPKSSLKCAPKRRIRAQPPGPGLPMQEPPVIRETCFMGMVNSSLVAPGLVEGLGRNRLPCVRSRDSPIGHNASG